MRKFGPILGGIALLLKPALGQQSSCDGYTTTIVAESAPSLTLSFVANTVTGLFRGQVVYEGNGWVGFGINPTGPNMVGARAVIQQTSGKANYNLGGYSVPAVTVIDDDEYPAEPWEWNATHSVLTFEVPLDNGDFSIDTTGADNYFVVAGGASGTLGFHAARSPIVTPVTPCGGGTAIVQETESSVADLFCVQSTFEILIDPDYAAGETVWSRGYTLDDASKALVIEEGRRIGNCDTCTSGETGQIAGFRIRVEATVLVAERDLASGSGPLLSINSLESVGQYSVGQLIQVEGYIMDQFCIDRGAFLDTGLPPLANADNHTVRCLVDPPPCIASPWEVLIDPVSSGGNWTRGFTLDNDSKQILVDLTKQVGDCTTCTGEGTLKEGFRAKITATIVDNQRNLTSGSGPLISVSEAVPILPISGACDEQPPITLTFDESLLPTSWALTKKLKWVLFQQLLSMKAWDGFLEEPNNNIPITNNGDNNFLVAVGSSNDFGYHASRHTFTERITCGDVAGNPPTIPATPSPTTRPSQRPTSRPSPFLTTPLPTKAPTTAPVTPLPSPGPSKSPTLQPSPFTTPQPTSLPTSMAPTAAITPELGPSSLPTKVTEISTIATPQPTIQTPQPSYQPVLPSSELLPSQTEQTQMPSSSLTQGPSTIPVNDLLEASMSGLSMTLFGVASLGLADVQNWEEAAALHCQRVLVQQDSIITYSTTFQVSNVQDIVRGRRHRRLQETVTLEYIQSISYLASDQVDLDYMFAFPFDDPDSKTAFVDSLKTYGGELSKVGYVSDVTIPPDDRTTAPPAPSNESEGSSSVVIIVVVVAVVCLLAGAGAFVLCRRHSLAPSKNEQTFQGSADKTKSTEAIPGQSSSHESGRVAHQQTHAVATSMLEIPDAPTGGAVWSQTMINLKRDGVHDAANDDDDVPMTITAVPHPVPVPPSEALDGKRRISDRSERRRGDRQQADTVPVAKAIPLESIDPPADPPSSNQGYHAEKALLFDDDDDNEQA
ncbi:thaumatin-like protein [Seminavis robusta]|uniref:Thaumatin-like protein n=1 Tax=Seminavis robusta TaxID=568900 RepID=A0A9N8HTE6_9STRA|nr:thaumatin-like protein [Seminavis robusta]|eukprot:Sro1266_g257600.1 thaumatin-like protein (1004) ;mRNA; f:24548-27989